jgi:hypothetical protein
MILTGNETDKIITENQIGYYKVGRSDPLRGEQVFLNKHQALMYATETQAPISYHWFDDAFNNFDRSRLGQVSLDEMYITRAKQLRESYEYLILNYSGGADSWNILKVFLDNNIKLDHIMVSWPISAVNAGLYTPNNKNLNANNFMSEWDFTMKPDIDWIAANYPEIKIELIDWAKPFFENPNFVTRELFNQLNHFHNMADLARSTLFSETERALCDKGVKVCTIWGIDKPSVFVDDDNKCGMTFPDSVITVGHAPEWNPHGTEYFYWTPKMPEIVFEMGYQTVEWFRKRPQLQKYRWRTDHSKNKPYLPIMQTNQIACRDSCYTTWASKQNKFQVQKPMKAARDDKDFWMYQNPMLKHHVDVWSELYAEHLDSLAPEYVTFDENKKRVGYKAQHTQWHYICDF